MGMHGSLTGSIDIAEGFYLPNTKQGTVDSCQHRSPYHDHSRPDLLEGVDCGSTDHDVFKGGAAALGTVSFFLVNQTLSSLAHGFDTNSLFVPHMSFSVWSRDLSLPDDATTLLYSRVEIKQAFWKTL
jgi:hypothetical protein